MVAGFWRVVKKIIEKCSDCSNERREFEWTRGSREGCGVWLGLMGLLRVWKSVDKVGGTWLLAKTHPQKTRVGHPSGSENICVEESVAKFSVGVELFG